MYISAIPKRAVLFQASDEASSLHFECVAGDRSSTLEIGQDYVYASRRNRGLVSGRKSLDLQVRLFRKRSVITEPGENEVKLGDLCFCPPSRGDEMTSSVAASLEAAMYLEERLFDNLINTILLGKQPEWFRLDIEKSGTLSYGWEPDGSRIEWKVDASELCYADITSIGMSTELFRS